MSFSFGGGTAFAPALVIQQTLATRIKARLAAGDLVSVSMSNAAAIPLAGSMASSSSRGPAMSTQHIKPEIGAPGASISAEAGTGSGETAFGGTSGAAPMVAGAAALLIEAHPNFSPNRIKALLSLTIDPEKLPSWALNRGSQGGNGAGLNGPEYDGYLTLTAGSEKLTVPWHVLPRRAAALEAEWQDRRGSALAVKLKNSGQEVG